MLRSHRRGIGSPLPAIEFLTTMRWHAVPVRTSGEVAASLRAFPLAAPRIGLALFGLERGGREIAPEAAVAAVLGPAGGLLDGGLHRHEGPGDQGRGTEGHEGHGNSRDRSYGHCSSSLAGVGLLRSGRGTHPRVNSGKTMKRLDCGIDFSSIICAKPLGEGRKRNGTDESLRACRPGALSRTSLERSYRCQV